MSLFLYFNVQRLNCETSFHIYLTCSELQTAERKYISTIVLMGYYYLKTRRVKLKAEGRVV